MPQLGEIRKGKDIGFNTWSNYIWHACVDCGKERWVKLRKGKPANIRCHPCSCKTPTHLAKLRQAFWRGGRIICDDGYIKVWLPPDSFFRPMANKHGYVREHRLVMAQHLGRPLADWEKVHHRDGIRDHNDWENLELTTNGSHAIEHSKGYRDGYQKGLYDGRDKQIQDLHAKIDKLLEHNIELDKQIRLLQWQNRELSENVRSQECKY